LLVITSLELILSIIQFLLTNSADINAQGGFYGAALQAAGSNQNRYTRWGQNSFTFCRERPKPYQKSKFIKLFKKSIIRYNSTALKTRILDNIKYL